MEDMPVCQKCGEEISVEYCMNCEIYICEECLCECNE